MLNLLQNRPLLGGEISWLAAMRRQGKDGFIFPDTKKETWRYTRLHTLKSTEYTAETPFFNVKSVNVAFDGYVIYFLNGQFYPAYSKLPQGVEVMPLIEAVYSVSELRKDLCRLSGNAAEYPFAALNQAYLNEGIYIRIEKNVQLKKPLVFVQHTHCEQERPFYNLHNVVVLEENAAATLLEYYTYSGRLKSEYFANHVCEAFLHKGAQLNHYKFQDEAYYAVHIALTCAELKTQAKYNRFCLQKGANLGRDEVKVILSETGASCRVDGIYKMSGWALLDTETDIEHQAPQTCSAQLVKGVVDENARGVFQGKIHICSGADKVEGSQLHKALLLSDSAEVDCKPELEIYADDVQCSHGAALGELDKEQLFYLLSRGIGEDEARQILIDAFLNEALEKIENDKIRRWFQEKL